MKIITDSTANLSADTVARFNIEVVPFHVQFKGVTYQDGVDLFPAELYHLLRENPVEVASTSQPSPGDFVSIFEEYPGEEFLCIHLSSGLSGAYSSAINAAEIFDKTQVTVVDTKTVGPALGWIVEAAALGASRGWPLEKILETIKQIRENTLTMVAFTDMHHLLHSGRISHLRGFVASLLGIKPIITMNDVDGRYASAGQERTMSRLVERMAKVVANRFGQRELRMQLMHGDNLPGAEQLREALQKAVKFAEDPLMVVTSVLGAHAGPTVFGLAAMPASIARALIE